MVWKLFDIFYVELFSKLDFSFEQGSVQVGKVCSIGIEDLEVEWRNDKGILLGKTLERWQVRKTARVKCPRLSSLFGYKFILMLVATLAFIAFFVSLIQYYHEEKK